jgi:hypothetical protein
VDCLEKDYMWRQSVILDWVTWNCRCEQYSNCDRKFPLYYII